MAEPKNYHYLRPYNWFHIAAHQAEASQYGVDPRNAYDNRFLQQIYEDIEAQYAPPEEVPAPKKKKDMKEPMKKKPMKKMGASRLPSISLAPPMPPQRNTFPAHLTRNVAPRPQHQGGSTAPPLRRASYDGPVPAATSRGPLAMRSARSALGKTPSSAKPQRAGGKSQQNSVKRLPAVAAEPNGPGQQSAIRPLRRAPATKTIKAPRIHMQREIAPTGEPSALRVTGQNKAK